MVRRPRVWPCFASLMPRPASTERVMPVSSTACPRDSSHCRSRAICVERPTPSVPSMTINLPLYSSFSIPGSGVPYDCFLLMGPGPPVLQMLANQHAHLALLSFDRSAGIYHCQPKLRHHAIVFFQNLPLKDLKAVFRIVGPADVHAGF